MLITREFVLITNVARMCLIDNFIKPNIYTLSFAVVTPALTSHVEKILTTPLNFAPYHAPVMVGR